VKQRWRKWWEAGEDCIMRSFTKHCQDDQMKQDEMGGDKARTEQIRSPNTI
jgi:hypothetical protein